MFENLRPTPTAGTGKQNGTNQEGFPKLINCRYCGFVCDVDRDAVCPFCGSDNYQR